MILYLLLDRTSESESIQDEPEQLEFDSDVADVPILDKDRRAPHGVVCFGSVAMDLITLTTAFPTENSHQKGIQHQYLK